MCKIKRLTRNPYTRQTKFLSFQIFIIIMKQSFEKLFSRYSFFMPYFLSLGNIANHISQRIAEIIYDFRHCGHDI